jgi:hypothetical protein
MFTLRSPRFWPNIVLWMDTNFSKKHAVSIPMTEVCSVRVAQSGFKSEDRGSIFLENRRYPPIQPRGAKSEPESPRCEASDSPSELRHGHMKNKVFRKIRTIPETVIQLEGEDISSETLAKVLNISVLG